jgi:Ser/Thr protein kinase RdoA (MazF antagonist)
VEKLSGAIPLALDQNDLHAHNVFAAGPTAPFRFFDFGDALWGHPFVTLACVHAALVDPDDPDTWAEDDPRLTEITDAYLHQWTDLAPLDVLHTELEAALPLHVVHRLVSWHRLLIHADETEATAWAFSPKHWIAEVIRLFGQH